MAFDIGKLAALFQFGNSAVRGQVIGVDIGASAIKVVALHNVDGVPTLDTYGELQLGPYARGTIGEVVELPAERQKEALVDIMRESSMNGTHAAFSVPNRSSFLTTLTLDTMSEADIQSRIPIEARKYVPIPTNEATLDWFVLNTNKEKTQTHILLAAIFNEAFQESERVLEGAGLSTLVSELEPFGAVRGTIATKDASVALLDLGASSTKVYVVQDGMVQDVHILRLSGSELTRVFAETSGIEFGKAEELKRSIGITQNTDHKNAVTQMRVHLERGLREVGKRITDSEKESGKQVSHVYVLGGGAFLPGLIPFAQNILQRPMQFADPFSKVAYPAFLEDTLATAGPSFAVALGVALRGLTTLE